MNAFERVEISYTIAESRDANYYGSAYLQEQIAILCQKLGWQLENVQKPSYKAWTAALNKTLEEIHNNVAKGLETDKLPRELYGFFSEVRHLQGKLIQIVRPLTFLSRNMDMVKKFVVLNDRFVVPGSVEWHRDIFEGVAEFFQYLPYNLAYDDICVCGGGYITLDTRQKAILVGGFSERYGNYSKPVVRRILAAARKLEGMQEYQIINTGNKPEIKKKKR